VPEQLKDHLGHNSSAYLTKVFTLALDLRFGEHIQPERRLAPLMVDIPSLMR